MGSTNGIGTLVADIELLELSPDLKRKVSDFVTAEWERQCAPATPAPAA